MNSRTSIIGAGKKRSSKFTTGVKKQSEGKCVLTGDDLFKLFHFIPHCKGSAAMELVLGSSDIDIDDPRNGICLDPILHARLGNLEAAFLRTPNDHMSPQDVPVASSQLGEDREAERRLTWQRITYPWPPHNDDAYVSGNLDASFSSDVPQDVYPDAAILDYVYGCAIVTQFATPKYKEVIQQQFQNEVEPALQRGASAINNTDDEEDDSKIPFLASPYIIKDGKKQFHLDPYAIVALNALEARMEKEAKVNQDKVGEWLNNVKTA
ncbi:hypothetical protein DXG01_004798 [Tephrocybe rancida]|nr:hypothetical protein DXG01_004798 [Tephrocybe rancida]